jgi:osmotically-inducible protein OsmY
LVGGAAATGVAAYQERGLDGVARDLKIQAAVVDLWFKHDHTLGAKLGIEVYESRVLLTGAIADEQVRADAVRLAWKAAGVKEVINEIQLSEAGGVANLARDSWITSQLKSKMTFDKDVLAINYSIETVNGIVYLIGIGQDQAELDRVIAHARTIDYVRKIVSHVRVKGAS